MALACAMSQKSVLPLMVVICFCVSGGFGKSFCTRNVRLDNKRVCDTPLNMLTSVPLYQCVRLCHNASPCLSLAYNVDDGKCELFSRIHVNPEDIYTETGNVDFSKRDDQDICDIPATIANGRVLYIDGQVEGSKAEFVCDDFHIPTTEAVICDSSGTWGGLDSACQYTELGPYSVPAEQKIQQASCVIVVATPTDNTQFYLKLVEQQGTLFRIAVCFADQEMDRNTFKNRTWGTSESITPYWPFVMNKEFNLTICAEETEYRVYVDNTTMFTFFYRLPLSTIKTLELKSDVVMRSIRFVDSARNFC